MRTVAPWFMIIGALGFGCAEAKGNAGAQATGKDVEANDSGSGEVVGPGPGSDGVDGQSAGDGSVDGSSVDGKDGTDGTDTADSSDGADDVADAADAADGDDGADGAGQTLTERVDFGQQQTNAAGDSDTLTVTLTDEAYSLHLTAVTDPGVFVTIGSLVDPDGTFLVATNWFDNTMNPGGSQLCLSCRVRVTSAESAVGVLVPNNPEWKLKPGKYTFSFHTFTSVSNGFQAPTVKPVSAKTTIHALVQRSPSGAPKASTLDLNLHFTGAGGLTAENAPTEARIVKALGIFEETYAKIGVSVGEVRYKNIDAGLQKIESLQGAGNDFETVAKLTAGNEPGVNIIFVDTITDASSPLAGFGVILGIAGGIPGPAGVQGTGRSAVFVAVSAPAGTPAEGFGMVMAHECGHYLGLFHSSELSFGSFIPATHDPLADTPEDDTSNLMYYSGNGTGLSPDQGFVVRNNAWTVPVIP